MKVSSKTISKLAVLAGIIALIAIIPVCAKAAGDSHGGAGLEKQHWPFDGPFGHYDKAAMQRGFQVYKEVCASCHSLKYVSYRNLTALGYTEDQIKAVASEYTVTDGPNDEGEMYDRPARPTDRFVSPFANDQAARYANGGAYPPDLSLMTKARPDGANYLYSLLTGYTEPPHGEEILEGKHYNKVFPGHWISMAQPLVDGQITYSNGESATVEQAAYDVVNFLQWAAEPHLEERKRLGIQVVLYLIALAGIMYAVKKKIWKNVH